MELNKKNKNGINPLLKVIKNNNIEMIKLLLEYSNKYSFNLEMNEKDEDGNNPLNLCIINNYISQSFSICYCDYINILNPLLNEELMHILNPLDAEMFNDGNVNNA